jgi:hypothetical protein
MSQTVSNRRSKRVPPKPGETLGAKVDRTPQSRAMALAALSDAEGWSHVLELHYWSREPGMLDIVRTLIGMPEAARATIEAFCAIAHEPGAITAELDAAGRLTLTSAHVGRTVAIMQFCSDNEDPETPRRPN